MPRTIPISLRLDEEFKFKVSKNNKSIVSNLKIKSQLGRGIFGVVNKVSDDHDVYALKSINLNNFSATSRHVLLKSIENEITILKKLNLLHGVESESDKIHILMKFIPGNPVQEQFLIDCEEFDASMLQGRNPTETQNKFTNQRRALARKIAIAAGKLHKKGIIHGDLNFNNLLCDPNTGEFNLIDFGLAKQALWGDQFGEYVELAKRFQNFIDATHTTPFGLINTLPGQVELYETFVEIYFKPAYEYMQEHKVETALTILAYGMFSMGAIYGVYSSAFLRSFAMSLIQSMFKDYATNLTINYFESAGLNDLVNAINQKNLMNTSQVTTNDAAASKQANFFRLCIAINVISKLINSTNTIESVVKTAHSVLKGELSVNDIYNNAETLSNIAKGALVFLPMRRLCSLTQNTYANLVRTDKNIIDNCERMPHRNRLC